MSNFHDKLLNNLIFLSNKIIQDDTLKKSH